MVIGRKDLGHNLVTSEFLGGDSQKWDVPSEARFRCVLLSQTSLGVGIGWSGEFPLIFT
jgi:hypothetical protein